MDITHIPMARGFVYLTAVVDGCSRRVLSHRVSIPMKTDLCVEALEEALAKFGKPGLFNTDQGGPFTCQAFTGVPIADNISIRIGGEGPWPDKVVVERIWKSVKYEEVYLHAYNSAGVARASLGRYLDVYKHVRPHSSFDRTTPDQVCFQPSLLTAAA
jgi:putative transposase